MEIKNNEIVTHRSNDCVFKLELSESIHKYKKPKITETSQSSNDSLIQMNNFLFDILLH